MKIRFNFSEKQKKKKLSVPVLIILVIIGAIYFLPAGENLRGKTDEAKTTYVASTLDYSETQTQPQDEETYVSTYSGYEGTSYYSSQPAYTYEFRNQKRLNEHFEKHGAEVGASSAEEYENMASAVVTNSKSLHKTEAEDGDDVYYLKSTGEFVVVSTDGYIRTYYIADYDYFNRQ